jgi:hypothetical protein
MRAAFFTLAILLSSMFGRESYLNALMRQNRGEYLADFFQVFPRLLALKSQESPEKRYRLTPTFPRQSRLPGLGNNALRSNRPLAVSGLRQR